MVDNFIKTGKLSDRELSMILKEAETYKNNAVKATVTGKSKDEYTNGIVNEDFRKSNTYFPSTLEARKTFNIIQSLIIQEYAGKKIDVSNISEIQYVHYPLGGKFDWHQDIIKYRPEQGFKPPFSERTRGLTFSLNLTQSEEYEGGNLIIKLSKDKITNLSRVKGSWIIFPSFLRHCVDEVTKGSRDAIVVWSHLTKEEIQSML